MTKESLNAVFRNPYDRQDWQNLLREVFTGVTFFANPFPIPVPKEEIKEFYHTGNIRLFDGKNLAIFELHVSDKINLKRNRVALHNIISKHIDQETHHGVLALFDSNSDDYRFTFTAKDSKITEKGFETSVTDSKRYTYVFGPNETCRTATDRFMKLAAKKSSANLDDIEDAFSVEKLTKDFFNKYKEQYEKFVCHLTGKHFVKKSGKWIEEEKHEPHVYMNSIFENNDKKARDFIKKSLGRLVFLYFLQKKGWLGCAKDHTDWQDGDQKFMQNYFDSCTDQDHFHSKLLVPLYFECLNSKRENDLFAITNSRIPYLNGGLFEEDNLNTSIIDFPIDFWQNLFAFFAEYNFTIDENDPFEQEVGIDPEMLGHIFENLLEDNKDKGAFYTPKPIVEYMCKESLIQYLKTHLFPDSPLERGGSKADGVCNPPSEGGTKGGLEDSETNHCEGLENSTIRKVETLENFIRNHDPGDPEDKNNFIRNNAEQIEKLLDDVKICDPAIGSGAFPMGLLQEIFWAKMTLDWTLNPAETKKKIIENSIYGVDIDSGAVDIARLRFWLSLIVDADIPEPLPNLDYKIMQGNSLLESFEGIDLSKVMEDKLTVETVIEGQQDLLDFANDNPQNKIVFSDDRKQKVQSLKNNYFSESDPGKKKQIHKEIDTIVLEHIEGCLEIHKDNLQLKIANLEKSIRNKARGKNQETKEHLWNGSKEGKLLIKFKREYELVDQKYKKLEELQYSTDRPFFLWHLYFSEVFDDKGGFDIVVGNPPYIKEYTDKHAFDGLRESKYYQGKMDIWYFFACTNLDILKKNGVLSFIATNNWVTNSGASKMRNKVISETQILKLIDFNNYKIFESAGIQTMIMFFKNTNNADKYKFDFRKLKKDAVEFSDVLDLLNRVNSEKNIIIKPIINRIEMKNKFLTFNNPKIESVLNKIKEKDHFKLFENEVANGIHTHHDCINKKMSAILGNKFQVGDGIFALTDIELDSLNLTENETKLIKPYFTTTELHKYYGNSRNKYWLIYTSSKFKNPEKMQPFPNLKKHLDKFKKVITSDNKPYGLHRTRKEKFFKNEKIIALRKCSKAPIFTYTDFDCYVSATFYVIQTERINLKILTSFLNSKSCAFWLKNRGKMQGNNYQIDKEPLLNIPIPTILRKYHTTFERLLEKILKEKELNGDTAYLEHQIDLMVYKLYELTYEEVLIIDPECPFSKEEYEKFELEKAPESESIVEEIKTQSKPEVAVTRKKPVISKTVPIKAEEPVGNILLEFTVGQHVIHPTFGEGEVQHVAGIGEYATITVKFGKQTKKLVAGFAKLRGV